MSALVPLGVVAAGLIGTLIRMAVAGLDREFNRRLYGTLAVNIAGSFLLGRFSGSTDDLAIIVAVGGVGALTTFSTFISQVERIARESTAEKAATYVLASVILGVIAALIGLAI